MTRERRPREKRPLPPPLPPETRTVGQLVAETIRFYGAHFWRALALGLGPAAVTVSAYEVGLRPALAAVAAGYLALATTSYIGGCLLVSGRQPSRRALATAFALGVVILLPGLVLSFGLGLLALAWLALIGLAVPAALLEELPPREALRRGLALGRADYVHAFGSLCALALVVFLTQSLLFSLLRGASDQATAIAAFLASLVISPLLFVGGAILYVDQAARAVSSGPRARRRRDADVSHAHNPH
jgi:hypothetical protein